MLQWYQVSYVIYFFAFGFSGIIIIVHLVYVGVQRIRGKK